MRAREWPQRKNEQVVHDPEQQEKTTGDNGEQHSNGDRHILFAVERVFTACFAVAALK